MATPKVLLKRSSVVGRTPTSSDLDYGELAINFADGKIHYKDANNNIKSFVDSAIVNDLITRRSTDSAEVLAIVQANSLDSSETLDLIYKNSLDSAEVGRLITTQALDSADAILLIDSSHVQLKQSYNATQLNGQAPSYYLDYNNFTNTPNVLDSADIISVALDSAEIKGIIDSAHVQLKQSYNALTLEGQNLSYVRNYNNLQNTPVVLDLVDISNHVDSAYVRLKVKTDQDLSTTDNVTFNQIRGPQNFIIDPAAVGDNTGTVQILGNLQVEGTQTTINSTTLTINDKNLVLADSAANAAAADGAGITIGGASATLTYNAAGDKFVFNKPLDVGSNKLTYSNVYSTTGDLPSASTYHGMFAHVHGTGKGYFAHAGNWIEIANFSDVPTTTDGLTEGSTNLYYTKARADSDIAASLNDSGNTVNISINTTITDKVDSAYVLARVAEAPFLDSGNATNLINAAYIETNRPAETIFSVVANAGNYEFTGDGFPTTQINPTLYLTRGLTYKINVSVSGHPFHIKTQNGIGTGNQYTSGVTNNGAQTGSILFTVPMNAPNYLHYNCQYHSGMNGPIYIVDREGRIDSADVATIVDSSYIQARQSTTTPTITIQDSGSTLATAASTLNFVGPGVVASGTGATKTITINATGTGGVDSASTINLIDSAYINARVTFSSNSILTPLGLTGVTTGTNNASWTFDTIASAECFKLLFDGIAFPFNYGGGILGFLDAGGKYYSPGNTTSVNFTRYINAVRNNLTVTLSFQGTGYPWTNDTDYSGGFSAAIAANGGTLPLVSVYSAQVSAGTKGSFTNPFVVGDNTAGTTGYGSSSPIFGAGNPNHAYTSLVSTIDSAYVAARAGGAGLDSAKTINLIDSAYVQARQTAGGGTFALAGNTGTHTFNTATETLTFLGTTGQINAGIASNNVTLELDQNINSITSIAFEGDSTNAHEVKLQAINPTADRTINLPNNSGTIALLSDIGGGGGGGGVDSAATIALIDARIDSNRVALHQKAFTFTADSATDFIFTGADDNNQTLTYETNKLSVFLNGILLIDSVDYTAQNGTSITLLDSAQSGDVITAMTFLGNSGVDSSTILSLIDSAYINARVNPFDSSHVLNLVDSAYIQLRDRFQDSSGILAIVDSAYVQARSGGGGGGGGGTITEVTDSATREAISSPLEGDVAIQFQIGPGRNTGVTHNFGGGTIVSWSVGANYTGAELTLNNSTFAAAAKPGDVIVVSSGTVQRYNSYHTVNAWQTQQTGNLIVAVKSITDANNLKVMLAVPVYWTSQNTTGYMNTNLKAYFDNASNPRGEIPANAVVAYSGDPNVNGTTGSQKLTGGTATLYTMFENTIKSTWDTSGITSTPVNTSDNYQGEVTALTNSNPLIWFRNDSAWKPYVNDQITGTIDSAYTRNLIDSAYVSSLKFIQNTTITEVFDSDQRVAISSPIEGDVAIQFRDGTGTKTSISHDFSGGNLWSKTVYLNSGTNSLSYTSANDVGNGRFKWSHSTFDDHVQKGDVIVVENATVTTNPGVSPWNSFSGTLMFACHAPKVGSTAPWYNIVAYFYDVPNGSAGYMNTDLGSYFSGTDGVATTTNPRGSIPAAAVMVHSYGNVNNSSATTTLAGGLATLYRMFDGATYQDAYDTSGGGGGTAYTDQTGTVNAIGGLKPLVYHYNDAAFKPYVQNNILGTVDSAYVNARVNPFDSSHVLNLVDSAYIQLRDRFQDSSGILAIVDSAYVQARTTAGTDSAATISLITSTVDSAYVAARAGGAGGGLDSAKTLNLIDSDYVGSRVDFTRGEFKTQRSQYTATSNQTIFAHTTRDATNLDVYMNGILQIVGVDYTATTSAVTFTSGLTAGFSVTIVERRGRVLTNTSLVDTKYYFTTPNPITTIAGNDDNGNTLDYSAGFLDVYLNGLLLKDSDDYSTNGNTIVTLVSATDSNDIVTLVNRKGVAVSPNVKNYEFTAAAGQTSFSGADINGNTLAYAPGALQVHLNGILLRNTDFAAVNGTSVLLTDSANSNDELIVSAFSNPGQNMDLYKFTADSGQTIFTGNDTAGASLAYSPNNMQVFMNGLLLNDSDDYTANNGMSVVLNTAADLNDEIKIVSFVSNSNAIRTNSWSAPSGTPIAASAGDKLLIDTSISKTVTLPTNATLGDEIRIIDVTGNASSNNIIINRNGHKIQGGTTNLTINVDRAGIGLVYYNVAQGWVLIEN